MPAAPSSPMHPVLEQLARVVDEHADTGGELLATLSRVPDPRKSRGLRYRLPAILAVAVAAVLSGARSFTAIGEWVADASDEVLEALGIQGGPPGESTIRRTLQRLSGDALDTSLCGWMVNRTRKPGQRRALTVDGKTLRGSKATDTPARHLMAMVDHHTGTVLGQVNVDSKTNEIPLFAPLCHQIDDLDGVVVTVDALHCQTDHADYLVDQRAAHYLLSVKGNQPGLRSQLAALPWKQVPAAHTSTDRGHGRVEKRSLKTVTVESGIAFPHAAQAIQITRKTRRLASTRWRTETVYAVTSLSADQATPDELATWLRGHWTIENRLHWVRDVTFAEDHSQIRTANGPRVMATIRNIAISLLRLNGVTNIAQALRRYARDPLRPLSLLLMTS